RGRAPGRGQPRPDAGAGRARGRLGDPALRAAQPAAALRRRAGGRRGAGRRRLAGRPPGGGVSELSAEQEEIRSLARRFADERIGAFALTEAGSGSDASAMTTRFADGRINGAKQWITNGSHASTILVFAREEDGRIGAFVVRDGFTVAREEEKLGLNSSSTA